MAVLQNISPADGEEGKSERLCSTRSPEKVVVDSVAFPVIVKLPVVDRFSSPKLIAPEASVIKPSDRIRPLPPPI